MFVLKRRSSLGIHDLLNTSTLLVLLGQRCIFQVIFPSNNEQKSWAAQVQLRTLRRDSSTYATNDDSICKDADTDDERVYKKSHINTDSNSKNVYADSDRDARNTDS